MVQFFNFQGVIADLLFDQALLWYGRGRRPNYEAGPALIRV